MSDWIRPPQYAPFRVDKWDARGNLDRELALVCDLELAHRVFWDACALFPTAAITLKQVTRLIASRRPDGTGSVPT